MKAYIVAGLLYGDEGKGSIVDYLVRKYDATMVVRYNGGPQAAHNVVTEDGRHHTFAQWGSGTFVPGVETLLSRYMLINPLNMLAEEEHLRELGIEDAWDRLSIDPRCITVTPWHVQLNRLRETLRTHRHGSCGQGIDEAMRAFQQGSMITYGQLLNPGLKDHLNDMRLHSADAAARLLASAKFDHDFDTTELFDDDTVDLCAEAYSAVADRTIRCNDSYLDEIVVFEGAQGVLLDECYGDPPHTTWGRTTFANALQLATFSDVTRVGVLRVYATRHGEGPFEEDERMTELMKKGEHNIENEWQGRLRCGYHNYDHLRYVSEIVGPLDVLAVNCLDQWTPSASRRTWEARDLAHLFAAKQVIEGHGPTAADKRYSTTVYGP